MPSLSNLRRGLREASVIAPVKTWTAQWESCPILTAVGLAGQRGRLFAFKMARTGPFHLFRSVKTGPIGARTNPCEQINAKEELHRARGISAHLRNQHIQNRSTQKCGSAFGKMAIFWERFSLLWERLKLLHW